MAAVADYTLAGLFEEPEFKRIVALAASLCGVPISMVSIVAENHQIFAGEGGIDRRSTPHGLSFREHALGGGTVLIVEDAATDSRFATDPLVVGPPFIRSYAGAPLQVASGHIVGTLCIISPEPRAFDLDQARKLAALVQILSDRMELRRSEHKRQANEERLVNLANIDQLTGLPNRSCFYEKAAGLLGEKALATVLLFDLDGFKDVNDVLGHVVGDRLLAAIGERLRRETDKEHVLARLGGDEFALMVPGLADPLHARRIATDLRDSFRRGFEVDGEELQVDTSIGVAIAPHDGRTVESLLMAADLALYQAKDHGGGFVSFFEPQLRHRVEARRQLQGELRQAFDKIEFEVFYQPQVELKSGAIVGAEALLRWTHPARGLLGPSDFLSVLERMPVSAAVGGWVAQTAIAQASRWREAGMPLRIAVNLFPSQFRSGHLAQRVEARLREYGLPPELLEIELTETTVVKNSALVKSALGKIREQGIGIALDDFGTGYASLSLLKELPVTRLKIDKSFVRDLQPGSRDCAVIDAILTLGDTFGLEVIAEGVETAEQARWLMEAGCKKAQGYFFGKPMPAAEFGHLLRMSVSRGGEARLA